MFRRLECVLVFICVCKYMLRLCLYMYIYIYMCVCVCVFENLCTCMFVYINTHDTSVLFRRLEDDSGVRSLSHVSFRFECVLVFVCVCCICYIVV
jgi:hypothetical protein